MRGKWIMVTAALGLAIAACSSDDSGSDSSANDVAPGGVPREAFNGMIADLGEDPDDGSSPDQGTLCPGNYDISAGQNTDYPVSTENALKGGDAEQMRSFFVAEPTETDQPLPLMIVLHGVDDEGLSTITAEGYFNDNGFQTFVDGGYLVVALQAEENGILWPEWDSLREPGDVEGNRDLDFFDSIVKCLAANYTIDRNRIYVAGHSAGGSMGHHILQRRSRLLAGGIVGSGTFTFTTPDNPSTLSPMSVIVTWAGETDAYEKRPEGSRECVSQEFEVATSQASQYYDAEPNVFVNRCTATSAAGHSWLKDANDVFLDFLDTHPKGTAEASDWTAPDTTAAECTADPLVIEGIDDPVVCPDATEAVAEGCKNYCTRISECIVENQAAGSVLACQTAGWGFSGTGNRECGGCVSQCEEKVTAGGTVDEEVAACFGRSIKLCNGDTIMSAFGLLAIATTCCTVPDSDPIMPKTDSVLCTDFCNVASTNNQLNQLLPWCAGFTPSAM